MCLYAIQTPERIVGTIIILATEDLRIRLVSLLLREDVLRPAQQREILPGCFLNLPVKAFSPPQLCVASSQ